MKKFCIAVILALAFGLCALVGCADTEHRNGEDGSDSSASQSATEGSNQNTDNKSDLNSEDEESSREGEKSDKQERPEDKEDKGDVTVVSSLAILDTVDIPAAFGDREAEGWSFALKADGDLSASYGFRLTSEISDEDKLNISCGLGVGLEDLFGIRSNDNNAYGLGLFGGGEASLSFNYRGPHEDSEQTRKNFEVGFRHDGDVMWYAGEGEGEEESQTSLSEVKEKMQSAMTTKTFEGMENAFLTIPEELEKGVSLRLAVEKLIDLGFTAEIDDSDGIAISLKANAGFYTNLLNDMLEELIPAKWLDYIPRADFGYEKTAFDIKLSFDKNGIFKQYSVSSDVSLTASLEVRHLFYSESTMAVGGGFSISAYSGEIPDARGVQKV